MPKPIPRAVATLLLLIVALWAAELQAVRRDPGRQDWSALGSPPAAPLVLSVTAAGAGAVRVQLGLSGELADGRSLPFLPESVLVRSEAASGAGAQWSVLLAADGSLLLTELPAGELSLTFSLLAASLTGLPSAAVHLMAADPHEPNDNPAQAALLPDTSAAVLAAAGLISSSLDFDFFRFDLAAGDSVAVRLAGLDSSGSRLQPLLSLLDSSGAVLAHSEDGRAVGGRAVAAGRYLVLVTDRAFLEGGSFQDAVDRFYRVEVHRLNRRGDLNGDGVLSYRDAFLLYYLMRGVLDSLAFSPEQRAAADWDGDGGWLGDYEDFSGLMRWIVSAPSRDPGSNAAKNGSPGLAAAAEDTRLEFADGSALGVGPEGRLTLAVPGDEAREFLALATGEAASPGLPLPRAVALAQNSPNPFNPSTRIQFSLERPERVRLEVFDLRGRRVARLAAGEFSAGAHAVEWRGTDERGRALPGGVYLYRLCAGEAVLTRKMVLLK